MVELVNLLLSVTKDMGYLGIVILMTIESSFIPFPSEIVIPPAAYLAYQGEMNIYLVVISGIAGSLIGALINYYLAVTLGRKLVYSFARTKWARFLLISEHKISQAEDLFNKYGNASTFFGRFLPGIRQLISIPAGLAKMEIKRFLFFTMLGSGIWVITLAILGWMFGANQEMLALYYREISLASVFLVLIGVAGYILLRQRRKKRQIR